MMLKLLNEEIENKRGKDDIKIAKQEIQKRMLGMKPCWVGNARTNTGA